MKAEEITIEPQGVCMTRIRNQSPGLRSGVAAVALAKVVTSDVLSKSTR